VIAVADQPDRYLVIDGYQRIAALEQLGRDTIEAVVWPLSEAEALVLDRSLRWSKRDSALEEGWLLAELEQRFGFSLEELARRFDRSLHWVAGRLALVEQLPESVQQQVGQGVVSAHVATKFLVPVAWQAPCSIFSNRDDNSNASTFGGYLTFGGFISPTGECRGHIVCDPSKPRRVNRTDRTKQQERRTRKNQEKL
jgi:hypothetical protein